MTPGSGSVPRNDTVSDFLAGGSWPAAGAAAAREARRSVAAMRFIPETYADKDAGAPGDQPDVGTPAATETRHTSGVTTSLVLAYLEKRAGRTAVDAALEHAGLADREAELRDEGAWHSFATKIRLFEAAAHVTGDREVCRAMGAAALELNIAPALKLALRAFGSPRMVYANVARANTRFSWSHKMELVDL